MELKCSEILAEYFDIKRSDYDKRVGAHDVLMSQKSEMDKYIETEGILKDSLEYEWRLFRDAGNEARKLACELFCNVASHGLQSILGSGVRIEPHIGEHDKLPTLDFEVVSEYEDYIVRADPSEESGGGVSDIVSLTLIVALNYSAQNGNSAPCFLDEPIKYLSEKYKATAAQFIKSLSQDMNKQIIMITHDGISPLYADKAYEVTIDNKGCSHVSEDAHAETELD